MKRISLICALMLLSLPGFGQIATQKVPDEGCRLHAEFTAAGSSSNLDNRKAGCTVWQFTYYSTGFSGVSVEFDGAPDSSGSPGSFSTWSTLSSGTLPVTATTFGTVIGTGFQPWLKIVLNSKTGTGTVYADLIGWRDIAPGSTTVTTSTTGTVTANAGTNLNTSLLNLEATQQSVKTAIENISTGSVVVIQTGNKGNGNTPGSTAINTIPCLVATSPPTPTTATATYLSCDTLKGGVRVVQEYPSGLPEGATLVSGAVTSAMTGTTSTSTVGGTASNYLYITQCTTSNASTTVSTDILLQDGSGGTTLYVLPAPAATVATTGGGGGTYVFPAPLKVPTAGNALYSANVTTGSSTKISCSGYKSTVSY